MKSGYATDDNAVSRPIVLDHPNANTGNVHENTFLYLLGGAGNPLAKLCEPGKGRLAGASDPLRD